MDETKKSQDRQSSKQPPIANNFALGYTYHDVLDADHEGMLSLVQFAFSNENLTLSRYLSSIILIFTRRSFSFFHTSNATTSYIANDSKYTYCYTTRLVATMVLVERAEGLDTSPAAIIDIFG